MAENGYNGWKNYETWNVALWINNDQGTQEYVLDLARGARECDDDPSGLADTLSEYVTDELPELLGFDIEAVPMMYGDMLNASLRSVDWYELAQSFWDDAAEQ